MISLDDVTGLCDLTPEEIAAIAEHEHIPEISAAALGEYLLHSRHGAAAIRGMIRDDIRAAIRAGKAFHARQLVAALNHFMGEHPEAASA
jgi:hypothetical protein